MDIDGLFARLTGRHSRAGATDFDLIDLSIVIRRRAGGLLYLLQAAFLSAGCLLRQARPGRFGPEATLSDVRERCLPPFDARLLRAIEVELQRV